MQNLTPADFLNSGQRGMGFALMFQGRRSIEDFNAFAATGSNTARVAVDFLRKGSSLSLPSQQLADLLWTIEQLANRNIRTIIVAGLAACRDRYVWTNKSLQASFVTRWGLLARLVKGDGRVAGFDLFNEPTADGTDSSPYADRQQAWRRLALRVIERVYKEDASRIVIYESAPDATPQSFATLEPFPEPYPVVYSLHSYMPMEYTHQTVMTAERVAMSDDVLALLQSSLEPVRAFIKRTRNPVWVGEFSVLMTEPGAPKYLAASIDAFERIGLSWSFHFFRGWKGWDAEVPTDVYIRDWNAPSMQVLRTALVGKSPMS